LIKMKKTIALAPAAGIIRKMLRLALATFLAAAAVAVAVPDRADTAEIGFLAPDSDIGFADSDGYVPLYHDCLDNDLGALYVPYYDGTSIIGSIIINDCAIERFGVGPTDLQRLIEHEMGHARGLLHSDDPNDIMYPYLPVTGT
jgi:Matrixin